MERLSAVERGCHLLPNVKESDNLVALAWVRVGLRRVAREETLVSEESNLGAAYADRRKI